MILFALDLGGNRVYIENAKQGTVYRCEECGTKLIAKNQGTEKCHHYAHKSDAAQSVEQSQCIKRNDCRRENQMSEWHRSWQERYPENQREIVLKQNGKIFRADVVLKSSKTIIEFQHSKINDDDFHARNEFYTSLGYRVIWLFDFDELEGKYKYIYPDQYSSFIEKMVRKNQSVYAMDVDTYLSIFGYWKPQDNKRIEVCFMQTHGQWKFYKYISLVTGNLDYDYPVHLFANNLEEQFFLSNIGLT